jgi:serine/threonine protein kinase
MEHLVNKHFIHRDLAARNVLLAAGKSSTGMLCKVADFGLSRGGTVADAVGEDASGENYYRSQSGVFPVRWTSPEAMETLKFSEASDVWSFGIVLIEMLQDGDKPFSDIKSNPEVIKFSVAGGTHPKPPACDTSAALCDLYALALDCFAVDPNERPPFSALSRRADKLAADHHADTQAVPKPSAVHDNEYEYSNDHGGEVVGETAIAFTSAPDDTDFYLHPEMSVDLFSTTKQNPCFEMDTRDTHNYTLAPDEAGGYLKLGAQSSAPSTVEPKESVLQSEDEVTEFGQFV